MTRPSDRARPDVVAAVAAGGVLGTLARYAVAQAVPARPGTFPWATFVTNGSGSFALGLLLVLAVRRFPTARYVRPFLATGFLGAFTTFSTFAVETDLLAKDGRPGLAAVYLVASIVVGLASASAGMAAGRLGRA